MQEKVMAGIPKKVHKSVVDDLNLKLAEIIELKKKLNASDTVNSHVKAMLEESQQRWKQEKKIHQKVTKEHKKCIDRNVTLRKLVKEMQEGTLGDFVPGGHEKRLVDRVAELEHSLEVAKTVHDQRTEREKDLKSKLQQAVTLKDLYESQLKDVRKEAAKDREENRVEVERLIGEIRGANFCFQKLIAEIFEQKGDS